MDSLIDVQAGELEGRLGSGDEGKSVITLRPHWFEAIESTPDKNPWNRPDRIAASYLPVPARRATDSCANSNSGDAELGSPATRSAAAQEDQEASK